MSTTIRPALSINNDYYISKHRYYELKHWCLQYKEWKKEYNAFMGLRSVSIGEHFEHPKVDRVGQIVELLETYESNISMLEEACREVDKDIANFLLDAVTNEGHSYAYFRTKYGIPCSRDYFYSRYRKLFWLLNILRG